MKRLLFIGLFALLFSVTGKAQLTQFKALYVYNFAKNVGWPESDNSADFVITVIGDNEMASELIKLSQTRRVGARKVVIKQAATAASASKSQMFYVGEAKVAQLAGITESFTNGAIIVCGKQGQCPAGAMISLVPEDGKLNYEISSSNIKKSGLNVSPKLFQLGIPVD